MRKIKWGILSTAQIAVEQIIPAIQKSSNGEVYAIASSNDKVAHIGKEFEIPVIYHSYEELLEDPLIDAVYIPLPNSMHYEWTVKAANAKKHVLCEKPAAIKAEDAEKMVAACKQNNVNFMEGFMYRFHPQHEKVKKLLTEDVIGNVKMMRACFSFYMENKEGNIRLNHELGGGSLYDIGCYCINAFNYILGTEPLSMEIIAEQDENGVDTSATVLMLYPHNIIASFVCSFDAMLKNEYELIGTKGSIRVLHAFRPDLNAGNGVVELHQTNEYKKFNIFGDQYLLEVEHFADSVLNGNKPVYSGEETIACLKIIDRLYEKLKTISGKKG